MKKLGKLRIVLVGLIIWGAVLGVGLPVVAATPWSGTVSYSLRDQAQFQVGYQLNDLFGLDLAYQDLGLQELTGNRWQTRLLLTPGDRLAFQAGYDWTGEHYLVGGQANVPLNQNIRFLSEVDTILPANSGDKYVDYLFGLQIGIGYNHYLLAGAQGEYQLREDHEPELFVELDLNWRLPKGFGIRLQPHVGVEGNFHHKTTVVKAWPNKLQTGLAVGQDPDGEWNVGLFLRY